MNKRANVPSRPGVTVVASLLPLVRFAVGGTSMSNSEVELFQFDDDKPNFESLIKQNGFAYWLASDLMRALEYDHMKPVFNAINKAMAACAQLNVPINENFVETTAADGGRDWKLSRFACYLTVMNGDSKNHRVAEAQAYFITMAEAFRQYIQEADGVERVLVRGEVSERERALSKTAFEQGVVSYPFFQNAGYRGLYNRDLREIRKVKHVPPDRSPLDFMGKTELAANLFRLTQTDDKIHKENIRGQRQLEQTAQGVGRAVRKTILDIGGTPPEALLPATDIREVKKGLKAANREYAKLDGPKKKTKKSD